MVPEELSRCVGSPCEIRTMENDLLCGGKIQTVEDDMVEIVSSDGERMPLRYYNTPIKINVFSTTEGRLSLGGNIYIANEMFWRVINVMLFDNFEKRCFFRVRTDAELYLEPCMEEGAKEETAAPSFRAHLIDVSLCGVGFIAPYAFPMGERFVVRRLRLGKDRYIFSFVIAIRRVGKERNDGMVYGASIEQIDDKSMDRLSRVIFALQREEIQRRRSAR